MTLKHIGHLHQQQRSLKKYQRQTDCKINIWVYTLAPFTWYVLVYANT